MLYFKLLKIQASFYQFLHHFASLISKSGVPALQAQLYVQLKEHFQAPGMLLCGVFSFVCFLRRNDLFNYHFTSITEKFIITTNLKDINQLSFSFKRV